MNKVSSSFRDPSGFVFASEGKILRQINQSYKENYELLMSSGLYKKLAETGAMVDHREIGFSGLQEPGFKVIEPRQIPFISYPYEWCFSQLKDAALLTLQIQKEALDSGMSLKDASSYNIQFLGARPVFIDTLSFEKYEAGKPWVAYKQFCEHFLAPLALISYRDERLGKLSQLNVEGIELDLAAKLLPAKARFNLGILMHIILHARNQKRFSDASLSSAPARKAGFTKNSFLGMIDSLESCIKGLKWRPDKTIWTDYYGDEDCVSYEDKSLAAKKELVARFLQKAETRKLWDVGANAGLFSRIAAKMGIFVASMDYDQTVIEQNYTKLKKEGGKNILPLVVDLANPSPAIGWHLDERVSIFDRSLPDTVLALALIHHLSIGKNLPFSKVAQVFSEIAKNLIIEFVPKEDRQTKLLLQSREDIFEHYNQEEFESEFGRYYAIKEKIAIPDSLRFLYLMEKK